MLKQTLKSIGIYLGITAMVFAITYMILVVYFTDRYNTYTYVNGIDATGMTSAQLNKALSDASPEYVLKITDYNGDVYEISGTDIELRGNYFDSLGQVKSLQNQFTWFLDVINGSAYEIQPSSYNYDSAKLSENLALMSPFEEYDNSKADVSLTKDHGKYVLIDETRPILDKNQAKVLIQRCIALGETEFDLSQCYSDVIYTPQQKKLVDLFEHLDKFQNTTFKYVDGDLVRTLTYNEMNRWLNMGTDGLPYLQDGRLSIDDGKMQDTIELIASMFNTEDDVTEWTRKDGTIAKLPYKGNGYKVNTMEEADRIQEEMFTGQSYERSPIYSQEGLGRGNNAVGDDYVEVDFEHQKMYCYRDGELKLESDCVTGNIRNHCNTPEMVSPIYFMQKNRTLHGDNYDTFVYYWMAFYNHYGLHDATWRSSFGNNIYLTNGSHGCVNLPKDVAGELYDLVYVGMPVVLYYGENQF